MLTLEVFKGRIIGHDFPAVVPVFLLQWLYCFIIINFNRKKWRS